MPDPTDPETLDIEDPGPGAPIVRVHIARDADNGLDDFTANSPQLVRIERMDRSHFWIKVVDSGGVAYVMQVLSDSPIVVAVERSR